MADIKLFSLKSNMGPAELPSSSVTVERELQLLIEQHCEALLGVRFLASEYVTGKTHGGRIDTLGIDENNSPVIIEYKRRRDENVINQGLYYLDWMLDHQGEFELLAIKALGQDLADAIDWTAPRVICIAGDFTKYDVHAIQQVGRNIELIRYKLYGDDLLLLELIDGGRTSTTKTEVAPSSTGAKNSTQMTVSAAVEKAPDELRALWDELDTFLLSLGDDVTRRELKFYVAYSRIKNFACLEMRPSAGKVVMFAKLNPDSIDLSPEYLRDVRAIGHYGTGDLEITVTDADTLARGMELIQRAYEGK